MIGHIGNDRIGCNIVQGGCVFGKRNEAGKRSFNFVSASAYTLSTLNTV